MNERDQELAKLIAEQQTDDTPHQEPQRFGAGGRDKVLGTEALGLTQMAGDDLDGVTVSGASMSGDYDEAKGPALGGRYVQREQSSAFGSSTGKPESEAERIVRDAVKTMTPEQQETYRLVFGERKSYAEAAEALGISKASVQNRVETLKRIVARALVQAAGGGDPEAVAS